MEDDSATPNHGDVMRLQEGTHQLQAKKRRRFTIQEKLCFIRNVKKRLENGMSQRAACKELNIQHTQYGLWTKQMQQMQQRRNSKAKSLCQGRVSILRAVKEQLLRFIFELREQGMSVSITMVMLRSAHLSREFREKSRIAQYNSARRFVKQHGLVHRMGTNESQRSPNETAADAQDFMTTVARPKVAQPCRDAAFIVNMDQTPVPFTFNPSRTLELIGRRTVHVRKSTNDTKRATFAMTVTASGKVLTPLVVFKGKPGGRIAQREFPTYPKEMLYACQENAWMDEKVMLMWVDKILKPYVMTAPDGIVPIVFLDSYRCHMMSSVVEAMQELGVEVEHIPGGCTGLCQPVDVGVNKPFKNRIRNQWERWMIAEGLIHGTTSPPTRDDICRWTLVAFQNLPEQMIRNSWKHGEYTCFPGSACERPPPTGIPQHIDEDIINFATNEEQNATSDSEQEQM